MRKIIMYPTILMISVFILSCKKGEDDPIFSLRTRKARLTGDWRMTTGNLKLETKSPGGNYSDQLYEFTENSYKYIIPGNGATFNGSYKMTLSFAKDGEVKYSQALDSDIFQGSGTWDFEGKVGELKNKEALSFRLTAFSGSSNLIDLFNKSTTFFTYRIKELRNDKLVLVSNEELIHVTTDTLSYYITCEYIFTQ